MLPEFMIVSLNLLLLLAAYLYLYPRLVEDDIHKLSLYDLFVSLVSLIAAGFLFWGSEYRFSMLFFETNWFWFTIASYLLLEIPFVLWYAKRYHIF